jgi:hypothetical protein
MRFYGPKIGTKQSPRNIESHKLGVGVCFSLQSGASSEGPDCLKRAVLGGPKTQRGGQNAILVNIAHILQLQHPSHLHLGHHGLCRFPIKAIFTRPAKKRCFGLCEGGRK